MNRKATVTIVLEYSASELRVMRDEDFPDEEFGNVVEEQVYEDLRTYLLSEPIHNFATIEIEDN